MVVDISGAVVFRERMLGPAGVWFLRYAPPGNRLGKQFAAIVVKLKKRLISFCLHPSYPLKARTTLLVPPKPKEFDMTTSIGMLSP